MNDVLLVKPKGHFLVRFLNGFVSFIVGLSAFFIFKSVLGWVSYTHLIRV